jgi:hypothetical protein
MDELCEALRLAIKRSENLKESVKLIYEDEVDSLVVMYKTLYDFIHKADEFFTMFKTCFGDYLKSGKVEYSHFNEFTKFIELIEDSFSSETLEFYDFFDSTDCDAVDCFLHNFLYFKDRVNRSIDKIGKYA